MTLDLNTNIDNNQAGFRLANLEVLNWGTFHHHIWSITPGGKNALLTGDIGSGKSTLVDAITTLLVPTRKIVYNKAAGAETRERSLKTYVQGAYKNEKVADSAKARDVYLRPGNQSYSVLIANFRNAGTGEEVALAQVLWMVGPAVSRMYLLGSRHLSVGKEFSDFGGDINRLRRRLRSQDHVEVHPSFTNYANSFRRRFGIRQPEALDLFYQTVSMKQVGNLTEFVRERMLGRTDIGKQIETLVKSYDDANAAHQAVLLARRQLELLDPLVDAASNRRRTLARITELEAVRAEIPRYFAFRKIAEYQEGLGQTLAKWEANAAERTAQARLLADRTAALARLRAVLDGNDVYRQLAPLESQIAATERELDRRREKVDAYAAGITTLNALPDATPLSPATDPETFATQREQLLADLGATNENLLALDREKGALHVAEDRARRELSELEDELRSLRERPTLIPRRNLELRAKLLQELNLDAKELPFAGELLRVRESAAAWEGAIERVLHGLGLSLLVPDRHYAAVSAVVNRMHLGGKLVYLRTLPHRGRIPEDPGENSLLQKVKIKGDSEHYDWLQRELEIRYNYQCCDSLEEFQRAPRGLTKNGQVKAGRHRHDKDDRHRVDDRRRYILGWTNEAKIHALETARQQAAKTLAEQTERLSAHRTRVRAQNDRRDALLDLTRNYPEFAPLDYAASSRRLQELRREHQALQARSGEVAELQARIATAETEATAARTANDGLVKMTGRLENACLRLANDLHELLVRVGQPAPDRKMDPDNPDVPAIVATYRAVEIGAQTASPALEKLLAKTTEATKTERTLLAKFSGES
ncbi:MAG: ATP-binding protein, partial [Bacteroidota bacterium]